MYTIYNSDRKFRIWAYTISHSYLVLRSEMKYPDQDNFSQKMSFNIDLEFWAVSYINLPSDLLGIKIKVIPVQELPEDINKDLLKFDMKIFEFESKESKYYVIAGGLLVGKNKWENEDRVFNYNSNLEHEEIIYITKK